MHQLWLGYMTELLPNLENRKQAHPSDESLQMRVCRADLHGALVKVTRSNVASQVGTEGEDLNNEQRGSEYWTDAYQIFTSTVFRWLVPRPWTDN